MGKRILVKSDNTTVVAYIKQTRGGDEVRASVQGDLSLLQWCQRKGILRSAIHIPGIDNVLPDNLLRGDPQARAVDSQSRGRI